MSNLRARRHAEQFVDELPHIFRRKPGSAEPNVYLCGREVLRLHGFQSFDILPKMRLGNCGGIGDGQLFTDIAGEILVLGFPLVCLRIEEDGAI